MLRIFEKRVNVKYLVETKELFLSKNENNEELFVNIVEEMGESDLEKEILDRKKNKKTFKPKEIGNNSQKYYMHLPPSCLITTNIYIYNNSQPLINFII